MRITIEVDAIPEVEHDPALGLIEVAGWTFEDDIPITTEDVAAFAAARVWYEQHPEVVPDGD